MLIDPRLLRVLFGVTLLVFGTVGDAFTIWVRVTDLHTLDSQSLSFLLELLNCSLLMCEQQTRVCLTVYAKSGADLGTATSDVGLFDESSSNSPTSHSELLSCMDRTGLDATASSVERFASSSRTIGNNVDSVCNLTRVKSSRIELRLIVSTFANRSELRDQWSLRQLGVFDRSQADWMTLFVTSLSSKSPFGGVLFVLPRGVKATQYEYNTFDAQLLKFLCPKIRATTAYEMMLLDPIGDLDRNQNGTGSPNAFDPPKPESVWNMLLNWKHWHLLGLAVGGLSTLILLVICVGHCCCRCRRRKSGVDTPVSVGLGAESLEVSSPSEDRRWVDASASPFGSVVEVPKPKRKPTTTTTRPGKTKRTVANPSKPSYVELGNGKNDKNDKNDNKNDTSKAPPKPSPKKGYLELRPEKRKPSGGDLQESHQSENDYIEVGREPSTRRKPHGRPRRNEFSLLDVSAAVKRHRSAATNKTGSNKRNNFRFPKY